MSWLKSGGHGQPSSFNTPKNRSASGQIKSHMSDLDVLRRCSKEMVATLGSNLLHTVGETLSTSDITQLVPLTVHANDQANKRSYQDHPRRSADGG